MTQRYESHCCYELGLTNEKVSSLESLLERALAEEPVDEVWKCEDCETRAEGSIRTHVARWPPIFAVALNRFAYDARRGELVKINRRVTFPEFYTVAEGVRYQLHGIIEHQGQAGGGHYVAYTRASDGHWYFCNDSAPLVKFLWLPSFRNRHTCSSTKRLP